jgi:hypothetical protein
VGWRAHISTPATEDLHGDFCPATEPYYVRIAVSPNPERHCGIHRDGAHHFQRPQRPSVSLPRAPKHNSKRKISNNWSPRPSPPWQTLSQDTAHLLKPSQRRGASFSASPETERVTFKSAETQQQAKDQQQPVAPSIATTAIPLPRHCPPP